MLSVSLWLSSCFENQELNVEVFKAIDDMRRFSRSMRKQGKKIGFVPTLGAIHEGHRVLIGRSVEECGCTVVSIFLNPTQFDRKDDLENYPEFLEKDLAACRKDGVHAVFAPSEKEMYRGGSLVMISIAHLADKLCGMSRPGHFRGVMLIVAKLLNIVEPDTAYFGEKDIQQLIIVKRMVQDLDFPVEIAPVPLVRAKDGLALSSRNENLTPSQHKSALKLNKALERIRELIEQAASDEDLSVSDILGEAAESLVSDPAIELDYFAAVDMDTLDDVTDIRKGTIFALAAYVGETRLIDNWIYR